MRNEFPGAATERRRGALRSLEETPLDVLVIGGGIVGAGVARDAAMRGLRVGLVEQHDFASGTSSRSSRLLHGGLRYLAQGRLGLVHEASVDWECELEDRLANRAFQVRALAVVNAAGPWAEGLPHSRVKLRLTKGVHVVVEHAVLPVTETVVMTEAKRILFAIPWGERTILGTTDTDYDGPLDDVMVRRTSWHYYFRDAAAKAGQVADWMGELLGWTQAQRATELNRYGQLGLNPLALHSRRIAAAPRRRPRR